MRHRDAPTHINIATIAIIILTTAAENTINKAVISPIVIYFSTVWSGGEDPFWPHVVLVPLSVLAGLAVGFAIFADHPRFSSKVSAGTHTFALWCLIVGVPTESICTVLLFLIDERIGLAQQSTIGEQQIKILALETRLAQRVISADKEKEMVEKLKPFAGTPFDFSENPSPEPETFADKIRTILKEAGWKPVPYPAEHIFLRSGDDRSRILISSIELGLEISVTKYGEWAKPLVTLKDALASAGFDPKANVATDGAVPDNAIHIYVGAKQ